MHKNGQIDGAESRRAPMTQRPTSALSVDVGDGCHAGADTETLTAPNAASGASLSSTRENVRGCARYAAESGRAKPPCPRLRCCHSRVPGHERGKITVPPGVMGSLTSGTIRPSGGRGLTWPVRRSYVVGTSVQPPSRAAGEKREPGGNPGLPRSGNQERTSHEATGSRPGKARRIGPPVVQRPASLEVRRPIGGASRIAV